jgi:hypothetical protein
MLLLPSAVVAICITMQRKWAYLPIIFFSRATVIALTVEGVHTVFVLKRLTRNFGVTSM